MTAKPEDISLTMPEFRMFQNLMYEHAGIRLPETKTSLVAGRLRKRLSVLGLPSYRAYHEFIINPSHKAEFQECLNALTTNETFFFRHKKHWDFLLQTIVPTWKAAHSKGGPPFRFWSAACSTGEEPYSAAIGLLDTLKSATRVAVEATDINEDVLNRAQKGVYGAYAIQKLNRRALRMYFDADPTQGAYTVRANVRDLVQFRMGNLLQPTQGPAFDVVFLRNVLIYFDEASKTRVVQHMTHRIRPGGYLFLGGAESLGATNAEFEYVQPTIYRRRG